MVRRILNITVSVLLSCVLLILGAFVFRSSYIRLGYACKDFGLSVAFYFCEMFGVSHNITPTVNVIPEVQMPQITLPTDFEDLKSDSVQYFELLFSGNNFNGWLSHISGVMGDFAKILVIILPCIIAFIFIIKALYKRENNNYGKDTVPLRAFKTVTRIIYLPIKRFVKGYAVFIRDNRWILICWVIMSALNLNLATIVIEFFAYYFFFAVAFEFATIYTQFVKLFADLKTPFIYFPYWTLLFLIYPLFDRFCKRIATARLRHYEARNCGFINELPIVSLTCGSMGKKKTTAITDM